MLLNFKPRAIFRGAWNFLESARLVQPGRTGRLLKATLGFIQPLPTSQTIAVH